MKNNELLKRVAALGFPLLDTEEWPDANAALADMVKSGESRFWEGFPLVLVQSAEKGLFNYSKASVYLKKPVEKSALGSLLTMSLALYKSLSLKFSWTDSLLAALPGKKKGEFNNFVVSLKNDVDFLVSGRKMSAQRLKTVFNSYFTKSQAQLKNLLSVKDELGLEYSLSQVFSPKQKELFLKKLKSEKLTKTEKEYFSRAVKKKVLALANPELHRLAQKLLERFLS